MRARIRRSRGGDGILATTDIRTIADLEGRSVAYGDRGISQFYVNVLLREVGLSQAAIDFVDLPADKAAEAFMLGEVDAAVTWEPDLTPARTPRMATCCSTPRNDRDWSSTAC